MHNLMRALVSLSLSLSLPLSLYVSLLISSASQVARIAKEKQVFERLVPPFLNPALIHKQRFKSSIFEPVSVRASRIGPKWLQSPYELRKAKSTI